MQAKACIDIQYFDTMKAERIDLPSVILKSSCTLGYYETVRELTHRVCTLKGVMSLLLFGGYEVSKLLKI